MRLTCWPKPAFVRWQLWLCILHYAAALAVFIVCLKDNGAWKVPVVSRFNVWVPKNRSRTDSCDDGCWIMEYQRHVAYMYVGYAVCLFSVISGSHHLYAVVKGVAFLKLLVKKKGVSFARWVDYFLSASLMLMVDSILWVSPPTVQQLVYVPALMGAVVVGGYGAEVAHSLSKDANDAKRLFGMACVPFAAAYITNAVQFAEARRSTDGARPVQGNVTMLHGTNGAKPPAFVYVIFLWIAFTYCLFPAALAFKIWGPPPKAVLTEEGVASSEAVFSLLSFVAKVPLLMVYAIAVAGRTEMAAVFDNDAREPSGDSDTVTYQALTAGCVLAFVMGMGMTYEFWPDKLWCCNSKNKADKAGDKDINAAQREALL